MSSEWRSGELGDFIELKRGYDLPKPKRTPGNIPLVSSSGITDKHGVAMVKGPGVVTGRYGTIGQVFYVEKDFWPLNTTLYVRDFKGNEPRFIHYFLKTLNFSAYSDKGAVPGVNRNHLHGAPVLIPHPSQQRKISKLLGSFDAKIDILNKQNTALESIAKTLFRSWFVDFDAVHAKAAGIAPEAMSTEISSLFPSEFEDSKLGAIPKGWQVKSIKHICQRVANGSTPSRTKPEFWGMGHNWFKTGELRDGFLFDAKEQISPEGLAGSSAKVFPRHSILMAIYAAPTVGRLGVLAHPATFNQAATGMVASADVGPWFLYQALYHGRAWFNNRSNGGAQQNISKEIVEGYPVTIPSKEILQAFNRVANPIYSAIEGNTHLIDNLVLLRDQLLPRLISGKLQIEDAEDAVATITSGLETEPT